MDALQAIFTRKSVRDYKPRKPEADTIEAVLKAANSAPNAGPFHLSVVQDPQTLQAINDKALTCMKNSGNAFLMERAALPDYQPLYGAPVLIVISAPESNPYSMANVSNAATCAVIAATALGLGSCYVVTPTLALNTEPSLAVKIGVPREFKPMCCVLLGYAGEDKFTTPRRELQNINYF